MNMQELLLFVLGGTLGGVVGYNFVSLLSHIPTELAEYLVKTKDVVNAARAYTKCPDPEEFLKLGKAVKELDKLCS